MSKFSRLQRVLNGQKHIINREKTVEKWHGKKIENNPRHTLLQKPFQSLFLQACLTKAKKNISILSEQKNRHQLLVEDQDLLCRFSGSGFLAASWATFTLSGICWETCLGCSAGLFFWLWGSTFWLECCVDLTALQTWVSDFWWLTGRWMRWGPFDTPKTRWCGVGVTTASWECCDTGIRLGPSPLDWNRRKAKKHTNL